jgi:small-conductance mechanosensitive channel
MLRANPKVWPETVVARLAALSPLSLDIEVQSWFETSDFGEFRDLRQEALLGIMRIVAEAGTSFAYATQAVHWSGAASGPAR